MAESKEKAQHQASFNLIYLLQRLSFMINTEKTILEPTQSLELFGFTVNTVTMELSLTGGPWSIHEETWHINCLELLVAMLALKIFVKKTRRVCHYCSR